MPAEIFNDGIAGQTTGISMSVQTELIFIADYNRPAWRGKQKMLRFLPTALSPPKPKGVWDGCHLALAEFSAIIPEKPSLAEESPMFGQADLVKTHSFRAALPLTAMHRSPDYLDAVAKTKWIELCELLGELGLLSTADRDIMAMYCAAFSQWREAAEIVKKSGLVIKTAAGVGANPCVQIAANAKREMVQFSALLGLDPESRDRFRVRRKVPPHT